MMSGNHLLDRLFLVGAGLIILFLAGAFIAALTYRRVAGKISSADTVSPATPPPSRP